MSRALTGPVGAARVGMRDLTVFGANDAGMDAALAHAGLVFIPRADYSWSGAKGAGAAALLPDPSMTWDELTDAGDLDWGSTPGAVTATGAINTRRANIWRLADRVFVGGAATSFAGNSLSADAGTSWLSDAVAVPGYLGINAQLLSVARGLPYAVVGAARTSDHINSGKTGICFGGAIVNDVAAGSGWGGIIEVQHENGASWTAAWELGVKSKSGSDHAAQRPYDAVRGGPHGIWAAGGGGGPFGGSATVPANSAITILKNPTSGLPSNRGGFMVGLTIMDDAIDGNDGTAGISLPVGAINMARAHAVDWYAPTGSGVAARVASMVDNAAAGMQILFDDDAIGFFTIDGTQVLRTVKSGTGGDHVTAYNGSGRGRLQAVGSSTNVDLSLETKGAGLLRTGYATTAASVAANFTATRILAFKDSSGTTYYIPCREATW